MSTPPGARAEQSARPLRRDAERNRQRILRAATEVFADRGLSASLDDIARHAEVGVGTVYRRFPEKQLLIDALFEERMREVTAVFERGLEDPDPLSGFASTLERLIEMQVEDRGLMELMLSGVRVCHGIHEAREQIAPLSQRLLERAQADGSVRPDVAPTDLPLIQMAIGSVVDATRDLQPDLWRRLWAVVLDGLRTEGAKRPALPVPGICDDALEPVMAAWGRPR